MSTTQAQSTTKSTAAPTTNTAAPSTSTSSATSNSAAQDAAGLSGEVPTTTGEGGLLETLPTMGEVGAVVLDAMPLAAALPVALQLTSIEWVALWIAALLPEEVAAAGAALASQALDAVFPPGMSVTAVANGEIDVPPAFVLTTGASVCFARDAGGWLVTVEGALGAAVSVDAEHVASLKGAGDNELGVAAGGQVGDTGRLLVECRPADVALLGADGACTAPGLHALLADVGAIARAVVSTPDAKVVASYERSAEAGAGLALDGLGASASGSIPGADGSASTDIATLAGALSTTGAKVGARLKAGGGVDGGRLYGFVEGGFEASAMNASSVTAAGQASTTLRVEAWAEATPTGAAPADSVLDRVVMVKVSFIDATETDTDTRTLEGTRLDEVPGLVLAGAACNDDSAVLGDLRRGRDHQVEDPSRITELLPEGTLPVEAELDAFVFETGVSFSTRAEVLVTGSEAQALAPVGASIDDVQEVQRAAAAVLLGEHYEVPGFDPSCVEPNEGASITVANVTFQGHSMGGLGGSLLGLGAGADAGVDVKHESSVLEAATADPEVVPALLSA